MDQDIAQLLGDPYGAERLRSGDHHDPHQLLGAHSATVHGVAGVIVCVLHPHAAGVFCLVDGDQQHHMQALGGGLFAVFLPGRTLPLPYRLLFHFTDGSRAERDDPYRFLPTVGELDLYLFAEGQHRRVWEVMGAHARIIDGVAGTSFAVWAPTARRVSVIGDFCGWDGRVYPMRVLGGSGVWELFLPGVGVGSLYKFEIKTREGALRVKTDPYAYAMELPPAQASCVTQPTHEWQDQEWMEERANRDILRAPVSIYELHLGSWARVPEEGNRSLSYRELAPRLAAHVKRFGFTHVELMPVAEHAFYGSWGYQITGYYAPTARYGLPDDFRYFVDYLHQQNIGVIVDWVPAHFPRDDFALRRFDGTALYEHADPRRGEHPDWGTLIFNYSRGEVKNFLVGNALYWLKEYHIDGLRVDAVASMLYLDYSRRSGDWVPNQHGGVENIEAISFVRATNQIIREEVPGAIIVAEESTSWFGVTRATHLGGLGYTFKWNMGWMHDTLQYFAKDPVHRKFHQDDLTFSMIYEQSERFINSLSHDEVVHGKRHLIEKMSGDWWQKLANLRLLLAYQYTRPGKQLLFMGTEVAQHREWNHDGSVDWHLAEDPRRQELQAFLTELGRIYLEYPAFWERDPDHEGFEWIDCSDKENSVLAYVRRSYRDHVVVVLNMTPVPRYDYRIGAPAPGRYIERLSSDDPRYGGSSFESLPLVETEDAPMHGRAQSMVLRLPPLGALLLVPETVPEEIDPTLPVATLRTGQSPDRRGSDRPSDKPK
jgi:1,4-alpha-glucan branching enzyme